VREGQPLRAGHVAHTSPRLGQLPLAEEAQASLQARAALLPPSVHLIGRRPGVGIGPLERHAASASAFSRELSRGKRWLLASQASGAAASPSATACGSSAKCDFTEDGKRWRLRLCGGNARW
jgi:hypothetical protein